MGRANQIQNSIVTALTGQRAMIVLAWAAYVMVVEFIAGAAARDPSLPVSDDTRALIAGAPALARWDSFYFRGVAERGYADTGPGSRQAVAFLPLYPLAMRCVGDVFGIDYFIAGLWVSRLSLLAVLLLLAHYASDDGHRNATECVPYRLLPIHGASGADAADRVAPPAALLAFPAAFLLVAVYSDSLFLALVLATFAAARRGWFWRAAAAAFLASLTRVQGLALAPALALLAWPQWRDRRASLAAFVPAASTLAAYGLLIGLCAVEFGEPLRHFHVRRESWAQRPTAPWNTLSRAVDAAADALGRCDLAALYRL
ncbi:MAG TPA: hypothetical protein VF278_01515, partial [Pirellulales bacterium]